MSQEGFADEDDNPELDSRFLMSTIARQNPTEKNTIERGWAPLWR
jgi:hypothetical protein